MTDSSIAHYRITQKIGQGGMGEVFRAFDTKLHRDVALKLLPDAFARDPDRMARFSREAQMLATLNHPNIASIHGIEESSGKRALVMELVEGDTLSERLGRGPIPLAEALSLARQMAEALEEAHERGIIHRDLKPANVKVTPNGTVKLLDFGLGKALEDPGSTVSSELSQSPTVSAMGTQAGVILGTAGYMSPEQARGQKVDRRCDIWSFGVVLYEMLSGKKAFAGDTVSDTLASVLKSDPEWKALPDTTPAVIRNLVRRCLERDTKIRLQSIGEARITIAEYLAKPGDHAVSDSAAPVVLWRRALPWSVAAVAAAAAVVLAFAGGGAAPEPPLRVSVQLGKAPVYLTIGSSIVLSPDGTELAYVEGDDTGRRLLVRPLDQLEGRELAGGAGVGVSPYHPFFSPDGEWVGYVTSNELRKVPVGGGTSLTLTKVDRSRGATWGPDGTVVFAKSPESGLFRVPEAGGEAVALTTLDASRKEVTHRWPQFLPDGKAVLFTSNTQSAGGFDDAVIEAVVVATGERKIVQRGGSNAVYVPTGHVIYASQGSLLAVPFDPSTLETKGSPAPVMQDVAWSVADGGAQFTISLTGRLALIQGENTIPEYPVAWVDRKGSISALWSQSGSYGNPRLSPDGKTLSLTLLRNDNWDIWTYDLERGVPTRLTFDDAQETEQVWSPDGQFLIYGSNVNGAVNIFRKRSDGSGEAERLTSGDYNQWPTSWSSDGRLVAYVSSQNAFDIEILTLGGETEKFLSTPFSEADPAFSPDRRLIAYDSNESGNVEVYVRSFPPGGGKWQVSDGGGAYPKWSRNGRELFYRTDQGIMVAPIDSPDGSFRAGKPRPVLEGSFRGGIGGVNFAGNSFSDYEVSSDGDRFILFPAAEANGQVEHPHVVLITRFFDSLPR